VVVLARATREASGYEAPGDLVARDELCRLLERSARFARVVCGLEAAAALEREPDLLLHTDARIENPSLDAIRNASLSLLSLASAALVTTSGDTVFLLDANLRQGESRRIEATGAGRTGIYALLPPWTGLAGVALGTPLNSYRRPDRLRATCLGDLRILALRGDVPDPEVSGACREYRSFVRDSLAPARDDLLRQLDAISIPRNTEVL